MSKASGTVSRIGDVELYALQYPIKLDGRFSLYADSARGYTTCNLYLFVGRKRAMLLDTGYGLHEAEIIGHVRSLLPEGVELLPFPLRWSEMNSTCNIRGIIEAFAVDKLYGIGPATLRGMEVRPRLGASLAETGRGGRDPKMVILEGRPEHFDFDGDRSWVFEILDTPYRLLATRWIYEKSTRTMITSDAFTHCIRPGADGPWTIADGDDPVSREDVAEHMHGSRYWWVPNAETGRIRRDLAALWARYDIERIAPAFGCMIEGKRAVQRHFDHVMAVFAGGRP